MTEENETKSHSRTLSVVIGILVALLLVYILSVGPVALCCEKMHVNSATVRQFYLPVIWLHDNTPLQKPLEMYIELWGVH